MKVDKENEKSQVNATDPAKKQMNANAGRSDAEFQDKTIYENIFKEMLRIENVKNLQGKLRFCLVRVSIENLEKAVLETEIDDRNDFLYKFSNFLVKNLRKKDIYLMSEPGNFLILFSDSSLDTVEAALKRIQLLVKKEYSGKVRFKWSIVIGTDKEQEIIPILKKAHLYSANNNIHRRISGKVEPKDNAIRSVFLSFIFSFLVFSILLLVLEALIYYGSANLSFIPTSLQVDTFFIKYLPGLSDILRSFSVGITPFFFFTLQTLFICLVFGTGMFAGFVINLKMRKKAR